MIVVDGGSGAPVPSVGVVVPTFKHPMLLVEALSTLVAQEAAFDFVCVVVVDGCPLQETADICAMFAAAARNIHVIFKTNAGPSSARNAGIDFLLATYGSLQAIFFLDADNRLQRRTLQLAFDALASAPPETGWIYGDIDSFGIRWSGNYGIPYSRVLHVTHQNLCDTGCLVALKVFSAGVRFDEDARSGYEDWDFWLQCLAKGFVGRPARFGLSYRQRPDSRNKENQRREAAIRSHVLGRHKTLTSFANLSQWEHADHPRFAWFYGTDSGLSLFSDPHHLTKIVSTAHFVEQVWSHIRLPDHFDLPPYFVAGDVAALTLLRNAKLLNNAFYLLMRAAEEANIAILTVEASPDCFGAEVESVADASILQRACMVICTAKIARELCLDANDHWLRSLLTDDPWPTLRRVNIRVPDQVARSQPLAMHKFVELFGALRDSPYGSSAQGPRWESRAPIMPDRDKYYRQLCAFFDVQDLVCRLRTDRCEIGFVMPIAAYGGAEKVAYALARTLRERGMRTHLFVLGKPVQMDVGAFRDAFDTRNFLDVDYPIWGGGMQSGGQEFFSPEDPALHHKTIKGLLLGLDLVINCHSAPLNTMVAELKQLGVRALSYLHVTDRSKLGRLVGHPYLAVAFEHSYDLILTCSQRLRRELHALGVPDEKIMAIPNTSALYPTDDDRARASRQRREPRGSALLKLLYIGRLDRQKGVDRLLGVLAELRRRNVPVECRIVGSLLLDGQDDWLSQFMALGITPEPPIYSTEELLEVYLWADVLFAALAMGRRSSRHPRVSDDGLHSDRDGCGRGRRADRKRPGWDRAGRSRGSSSRCGLRGLDRGPVDQRYMAAGSCLNGHSASGAGKLERELRTFAKLGAAAVSRPRSGRTEQSVRNLRMSPS